jgi:hypothetical protein
MVTERVGQVALIGAGAIMLLWQGDRQERDILIGQLCPSPKQ